MLANRSNSTRFHLVDSCFCIQVIQCLPPSHLVRGKEGQLLQTNTNWRYLFLPGSRCRQQLENPKTDASKQLDGRYKRTNEHHQGVIVFFQPMYYLSLQVTGLTII